MDKKLIRKHGIDLDRLNKKVSKNQAKNAQRIIKKEQKEAIEKARREALIQEVLSKYEIDKELQTDHKVTYEDVVVREYDALIDVIAGLTTHLECATFLPIEEQEKMQSEIDNFIEIRKNLIEKDRKILIKAKRINK